MILGFIGTGVITEAIVRGLIKSDYPVEQIFVSTRSAAVSSALAALSPKVCVCDNNQAIADGSDILFLAVLPQDAQSVISALSVRTGTQIVSLIATVSIDNIRAWSGSDGPIFRAIPLPSVAELTGVSVIFPPSSQIEAMFNALGRAVCVTSIEEFDAYAVASAMMGLYFGLSETVTQWLCDQGNDYPDARAYMAGTFQALANTATASTGESFDTLRVRHSTPGGLNEQMFAVFDAKGGTSAVESACASVATRIKGARQG